MSDNIWIVDIVKIFKDQRYIICLSPSLSVEGNASLDVNQLFTESRQELDQDFQKINKSMQVLSERISQQSDKLDN